MIKLAVSSRVGNFDDDDQRSLKSLFFDSTHSSLELKQKTEKFLENLDLVINCVQSSQFFEVYFLGFQVSPLLLNVIKGYIITLLLPGIYKLIVFLSGKYEN